MFAWRRANVAELNRLGRLAWGRMGHLGGPELTAPGGATYAAGDRIVTLAPGARGQLVTSERGSVVSVDPTARTLVAAMDDGRRQDFATDDLDPDRLAHGYAVTVHRSQGLTVDATHGLDDGGGRELAYVRMSRARQHTLVYVVADDMDQATEDLRRGWANETRQRWAIDRAPTAARAVGRPEAATPAARLARLVAEHESLSALVPPNPETDHRDAEAAHRRLGLRLEALDREHCDNEWAATPVGDALRAWRTVAYQRGVAEHHSHEGPWHKRPGLARQARALAEREAPLEAAYRAVAAPERARLVTELAEAETVVGRLDAGVRAHHRFTRIDHPEVPRRLQWLEREMHSLSAEVFDTRMDLDNAVGAGWAHADASWADRDWHPGRPGAEIDRPLGILRDRAIERAGLERDLGPDLGIGL